MNDQWLPPSPNPPPAPVDPSNPFPPANSWNDVAACSVGPNQPSFVDGVVITGVPATISAPYAWSITLNDGSSPPNFSINRNDSSNNLIDQPIQASGANGQITFPNAIFVNGMQVNGNAFVDGAMQFPSTNNLFISGGTAGQVLTSQGAGGFLGWANLPSPPISTDAPLDGNLYGRSNGTWSSGGRIITPLSIYGANMFALLGDMGSPRSILAGTGSTVANASWRWQMQLADYSQETGGNAGSNFVLTPFSDTGQPLPPVLTINRATGSAVFQGPTQILGPFGNVPSLGIVKNSTNGVSAIVGQASTGPSRWQLYLGDYTAELGNNYGSDFRLNNYSDNGTLISSPLLISRASGAATFGYGVTVTGNLVGSNAQFTGQLVLNSGPSQFQLGGGAPDQVLTTNGLGSLFWSTVTGGGAGGIEEAPLDGTTYARNDAAWTHLVSADISDLATTLGAYLPLIGGVISGPLTVTGATNVVGITSSGTANLASLLVQGNSAFTGSVTISNAPIAATQAANKGYVDGLASTTLPLPNGPAAVGTGTTWARADHVHPSSGVAAVTISDTPPLTPAVGALWWDSVGGQMYVWYTDANSSQWVVTTNGGGPTASSTLPLANGTAAVGVSAAYARADHVHPVVMGDNRIINGDMRIDQRNNGASGTANSYTVDRWLYGCSLVGKGAWQQARAAPAVYPGGFGYCLLFTSSSAYVSLAGDYFAFEQLIEADMVTDFAWGTANAQPVTLSFWAFSSKIGTFSGSITNAAQTRSYPFSYSIPSASTWVKTVVTIPGDTAGTWVTSGNAASIGVWFDLGTGTTNRGPANAWAGTSYVGVTGSQSIVATNGAQFGLTGVKLEIGSVATPFNRQSLAKSMADCQRYFSVVKQLVVGGGAYTTPNISAWVPLSIAMRAAPTATFANVTNANTVGMKLDSAASSVANISTVATAIGIFYSQGDVSLSAEL